MKRLSISLVLVFSGIVALDALPSSPGNLSATVTGTTVTLSWTAPPGSLLGYRLEAGSAPGLSDVASTIIGTSTTFSAPNVPTGTYHVRVRAIAVDGESLPSNEVVVAVGGAAACATAPNAPVNVAAALSGTTVNLTWESGGGCAATNYVVQAGSAPGSANLAVVNAGNVTSFTATAPPGLYYLRVIAQNAFGSSGASNQVTLTVGGTTTPMGPLMATVNADSARLTMVTMPATGRYQATLTWADPSIDLDLYLADPTCLFYPPLPCLRAVSAQVVGNSEQVSWLVRAGERYALWIDNWSNRSSAYMIQHLIMTSDALTAEPSEQSEMMVPPLIVKQRGPR
jgi:predicted phage tail protein